MKNKNLKRVISFVTFLALLSMATFVFATVPDFEGMFTGDGGAVGTAVNRVGGNALVIVRTIGWMIAVGLLIWLGIKWVLASAQEKADLKKNMWNYVIGAVLIFGASSILPVIANFAATIGGE
jgi:TrbC/VIRB2 family.